MTARIQEGVHDALLVPAQNDRLLPHSGRVEVARLGDEALVPDEQPGPREDFLQLLLVEIGINKNFAADEAPLRVNELVRIIKAAVRGHDRVLHVVGPFGLTWPTKKSVYRELCVGNDVAPLGKVLNDVSRICLR